MPRTAAYTVTLERDHLTTRAPKEAARIAARGWELNQAKKDAGSELEQINARLIELLGPGVRLQLDGAAVTLAPRTSLSVTDPERLRQVLGGRFDDLVETAVRYTVSDGLREIAAAADHPLHDAVCACLTVSESVVVSYRAAR